MTSKKKNHKKLTSELEISDERSDNPQEVRSVNISIILEYIYINPQIHHSFIPSLTFSQGIRAEFWVNPFRFLLILFLLHYAQA